MATGILIQDAPADGPWNMAVDEVLLKTATERAEPVLRFYQWSQPTLSLGYFQQYQQRHGHVASETCPIVRRSTGGGAIVHDGELTYCFAMRAERRIANHKMALYHTFHRALIGALADWGISATQPGPSLAGNLDKSREFLCFHRLSSADVLVKSRKVAGSAQRRTKDCIIQHGSVLLTTSPCAPELPGIAELTGILIEPKLLIERWSKMLGDGLALHWEAGRLTAVDLELARQLANRRFASDHWLRRR